MSECICVCGVVCVGVWCELAVFATVELVLLAITLWTCRHGDGTIQKCDWSRSACRISQGIPEYVPSLSHSLSLSPLTLPLLLPFYLLSSHLPLHVPHFYLYASIAINSACDRSAGGCELPAASVSQKANCVHRALPWCCYERARSFGYSRRV